MSAADWSAAAAHLRERARTYPGAEGRLALMKMARELEGIHENIEREVGEAEPERAVLWVNQWSVTREPPDRRVGFRIRDGIVDHVPAWLLKEAQSTISPMTFRITRITLEPSR